MSGKPKDPNRQYSPNYGGPGRGQGRKPNSYPPQTLRIAATDEEKEEIEWLTARQRAEILLEGAKRLWQQSK